ncbi:MAG: HupE/UreJ family protein [Pseudomonadota bacterium]
MSSSFRLGFIQKVVVTALMSTLTLLSGLGGNSAHAHTTREAIADLRIEGENVFVEIYASWEPYVVGMDLDGLLDTNDSPNVAQYDALRARPDSALMSEIQSNWPRIAAGITLEGAGPLTLDQVVIDPEPDLTLPRDGRVYFSAPVTSDTLRFGWQASYGPLILRTTLGDQAYAELLDGGQLSAAISVTAGVSETTGQVFWRFIVEGYEHIIPKGLDHILFVLGLFFFSLRWGPLLSQVTAFTLAHTVTLGLATLGYITIGDDWMWLVEALIALSITYVAIENIFRPQLGWWRIVVVFGFGLLHGLGFASVLGDLGLAQGQFILSLVAFNIGVEIGQLAVIFGVYILLWLTTILAQNTALPSLEQPAKMLPVMHRSVSLVGSLLIGLIGLYWVWDRIPL